MTLKRLLSQASILLLLFVISFAATAQDKTISGKITDSKDGSPVIGASVVPKGSSASGTTTGADGTFRLTVGPNVTAIVISYVGYGTQEVSITGKTTVDVSLSSTGSNLNEVVVVGYGTARKKDLTGAVTSVRAKDFNKGIQPAPDQLIQGKVAGVQVVANSGAPGGGTTVRIRGTSSIRSDNTPLFVVDGVPLSNTNARPDIGLSDVGGGSPAGNPLNFISPNDIASMEVLKDASAAAIYGSRGANGVVLITTKRGQSGAPRVDLNASVGVSTILKRLEVLDGNQYRAALGEYGFPTNVNAPGNPSANFGADVDALDAILRTAITQNYGVAVSSGTDAAKYRLSLGLLNQEGIVRKTDFKKYTANFSSQFKLLQNKRLGLDFNLIASQTTEHVAPISNSAGFKGSLIGQALQWNPTRSLKNADGTPFVEFGSDNINPLAYSEAYFDEPKVTTILASISPSYKITDDLEYRMQVSVNYTGGVRKQYTTANININDVARAFNSSRNDTIGGEANVSQNELRTSQVTNTLSYVKDINSNLSINAVIGHEYLKTDFSGNSDYARGFLRLPLPLYTIMSTSDPSTRRTNGFKAITSELQSYFGRAILNIQDKYVFTGTIRADGSSKFGENNRYGYFPSVAAAWNINRESFFEGIKVVNALKLRASWGVTGNQEFPAGASQTLYTLTGSNPASIAQSQFANPDLKWESTTTLNVGVDFTIWNNRLSGSVDYFTRTTKDLLFPREAADPVTPNGAIQWQNIPGELVNSGLEVALNVNIVRSDSWNWDLGVNATFLKNELTQFGALQIPIGEVNGQGLSGAYAQLLVNNQPLNSFYLKKFIGIDKSTGVSLYEGGEEKFFLGSPNPKTLIGLTTNVSWKKLNLEVAMNGAYGHYLYNNTANAVTSFNNLGKRNIGVRELEIARSVGEQPVNPTSASSRYLEKGDFLKMANATLSYNIGALGKNVRSATVFVTGQNLFVITDFSGFDPEVNTSKTLNNIPSFGMEYTPYPTARTINFGVNFSF
jgi:TonB-dependent starch-binding outer membrane protein SusC